MSEFEKILNETSSASEENGSNAKYVKLTYTKSGTIVLSATNNKSERISVNDLNKFANLK